MFCFRLSSAQEEEKNYSISLVKTAEVEKDIHEVDDRKVLTQTLTVQKGDWVWKILREKGLLKRRNLSQLLSVLKKLNKSFDNLDLIHPGETIIIPIKIAPVPGAFVRRGTAPKKIIPIADLKDLDFEKYTVQPDDTLIRVLKDRYGLPPDASSHKYLEIVKQLNPSLKNIDTIYPGQVIRLPVYSPQIVRMRIKRPVSKKPAIIDKRASPLAYDLASLFSEIGEKWVQAGKHYIPLKSGGQIALDALTFPILNLRNGQSVVIDLNNKLPAKMARLIGSSWDNFRVVRLKKEDDLASAMEKTLRECSYPKVFKKGEPLNLKGDISLRITGDWIVALPGTGSNDLPNTVVINMMTKDAQYTPEKIKDYLWKLGIKVVDYPTCYHESSSETKKIKLLYGGNTPSSLVKKVLNLVDRPFSFQVDIPLHEQQKSGFKLTTRADFLLETKARNAIIDLTGLAPEMASILRERKFLILSLAAEKDPLVIIGKVLEFLDIDFDYGPRSVMVTNRHITKNIKLIMSGITFSDISGASILATSVRVPDEIGAFLSEKGYRILRLTPP